MPALSDAERERYARHLEIPGVGEEGQRRLRDSSVLLIGTGGLGSPAAMYLAAAGVGRIGLVDDDRVERSNLQRQILHGESSVGQPKLDSAIRTLREINPHVDYVGHPVRFTPENAAGLVADYDLVVDGSDNFPTRFLSNDACYFAGKPLVYGSIFRFEGQVGVFAPHRGGPCYRCMLPELPPPGAAPSCAEAGVLGVLPGVIGSLQAMEAIKLLAGLGSPPLGKLVCYDALRTSFRDVRIDRDPRCRLCGDPASIRSLSNPETGAPQGCGLECPSVSVAELRAILSANPATVLVDVRQPEEHARAAIPGSRLIPLAELPARLRELPGDGPVYLHCKSGRRSAQAVEFLRRQGIDQAVNVAGGIDAWLAE
ncbi:molybdopterin-synthase adenylyltransferase MoeB [Haloferula sp. A504]|uniref:molybdopterin-synthase adenylyltransferase MoeB n=1 Tax=Haloferula sp. A504 TaxID=3373601 RepID=UPI0031C405CF|nr:molybdopterin-synthase adenylyltransferase MoeB [Verrucomicrobiaceae bacterium E54]